jgi:hypothetical protein
LLVQNNSLVTSSVSSNAFSFISLQNFTQLTTLDVSQNEFTGTIPESIFKLPALEVFAAGSNCFTGVLPTNICNATELNTIAISGLSTADSCKRYYWKGTAFSGVFLLGFQRSISWKELCHNAYTPCQRWLLFTLQAISS